MATVINLPRDTRLSAIGQSFGQGVGASLARGKEEKEKQLGSEFLSAFRSAPDRKSAIEISRDPRYSSLFNEFEDAAAFGSLLDQQFPSQETVDIVSGLDAAEPGRFLRKASAADPKLGKGERTAKGFERGRKIRADRRTAAGTVGKTTDAVKAATGVLQIRGVSTPSSTQVNNAIRVQRQAPIVGRQLANTYRITLSEKGLIEKFENPGDAQRFTAATSVIEDLMFGDFSDPNTIGLTSSQTLRAAKNVGDAIFVQTTNIKGEPETKPPIKPAIPIKSDTERDATPNGEDVLSNLKASDVGIVLERDGDLFIFVGFGPAGEVLVEPVNINMRGVK